MHRRLKYKLEEYQALKVEIMVLKSKIDIDKLGQKAHKHD